MKKFIKNVMIFILPILVLATGIEVSVRNIPNDYAYKKNYLDQHSGEIEVLFLGSSHAYRGINPNFLDANSFNASYVSQTLDIDYEILNKYKNHFDSLQYLVIPISYFSLFTQLESTEEAWRIKNYTIYYGLKISSRYSDYFELSSNKLETTLERLKQFYIDGKTNISSSKLGWGDLNSKSQQNLEKTGREAAERHTEEIDIFLDENLNILRSIIDLAEERKIVVIFYTPPAYQTYVELLDSNQLNRTYETMYELDRKYDNVIYVNFLTDNIFTEKDFYNADHLNNIGAEKLTKKINQIIFSLK